MNFDKFKGMLISNVVPIMFAIVCVLAIAFSGVSLPVIFNDVIARFDRNAFLVLSLIIPILAGMGLNFGIVLGAMAGQIGLFFVTLMGVGGVGGLLLAIVIGIPLAALFGYLAGLLLNRTKGQEMITSMILGFFAMGLYQFFFLYFLGGVIPVNAPTLMMGNGIGVRNTIDLTAMKYGFDNILKLDVFVVLAIAGGLWLLWQLFRMIVRKKPLDGKGIRNLVLSGLLVVAGLVCEFLPGLQMYRAYLQIPVVTFLIIGGLCAFMPFFMRTKLGQDMRACGQDMHIAGVSGINVNRTRIVAICISCVLACIGQVIFLQNLGNISTYNAHENVGMFAAAALLIGGASVSKATVGQALLGTFLFHLLFNVSPMAGQNLFGSAALGEYFRVFIAYGIIAITLALYAWKQVVMANRKNRAIDREDDAK